MHIDGVTRLPTRLLTFTNSDGELIPTWLGDRDRPWLRELLEDAAALAGRPFAAWQHRWSGAHVDPRAGRSLQRMAVHVLGAWLRRRSRSPSQTRARRTLFELTAQGVPRSAALRRTAERHGSTVEQLARGLFDDIGDRRTICWPDPGPDPTAVAAATNLALVRGMLHHARQVEIDVRGNTRTLLRTAWLRGMQITTIERGQANRIRWQKNPAARTCAASALLTQLPWAYSYRLRASCEIDDAVGDLVLVTGDPIAPGPEPRRYDSALERDFARDFRAAFPEWSILREPCAVATKHGLAFPDFSLQPPRGRRWLCELTGLRDPSALPNKLQLLTARRHIVLCIPDTKATAAVPIDARIVRFTRRIDPRAVAAVVRGFDGAHRDQRSRASSPSDRDNAS